MILSILGVCHGKYAHPISADGKQGRSQRNGVDSTLHTVDGTGGRPLQPVDGRPYVEAREPTPAAKNEPPKAEWNGEPGGTACA